MSERYDAEVAGHGPYQWTLFRDVQKLVAQGTARTRFGADLALRMAKRRDIRAIGADPNHSAGEEPR